MTSVRDTGQDAADELKQKGERAAERTQQKAQEAGEEAKSKLRQEVDQRSQQIAEQVESTADAIRKAGDELRKQGKDQPADLPPKGSSEGGAARAVSEGVRLRADPERHRGHGPPEAPGGVGCRRRRRLRFLSFPKGVQRQAPSVLWQPAVADGALGAAA